jgi:sec-independent protein translocase protein TatB
MFGLGTWELALILVAALIFIGPNKLPDLARNLGKGMREMRRAMAGFEREVQEASRLEDPKPADAAAAKASDVATAASAGQPGAPPPEARVERAAPTSRTAAPTQGATSAAPGAESEDA